MSRTVEKTPSVSRFALMLLGCTAILFTQAGQARAQEAGSVPAIVLINPNSNENATRSMAGIAQSVAGDKVRIIERTNENVPALLTTLEDMVNAAAGVASIGAAAATEPGVVGIIVSAFSDPGLNELRAKVSNVAVVGIGEEAFHEAASGGRPFSIVTITPDAGLVESFRARAEELGYLDQYRGVVVTPGDPKEIVKDSALLDEALAQAVDKTIREEGVQAVIMGGGPLSAPAVRIQSRFDVPLVVAVAAATRAVLKQAAEPSKPAAP